MTQDKKEKMNKSRKDKKEYAREWRKTHPHYLEANRIRGKKNWRIWETNRKEKLKKEVMGIFDDLGDCKMDFGDAYELIEQILSK